MSAKVQPPLNSWAGKILGLVHSCRPQLATPSCLNKCSVDKVFLIHSGVHVSVVFNQTELPECFTARVKMIKYNRFFFFFMR